MLHILWIILKIILIVLAVILGFLLLLLLILLFCPLCYSAYGARDDSGIRGRAKVHWLFHAISAQAVYEGENGRVSVKILGIPIEKLQSFFARFQKKKEKKQESVQSDSSDTSHLVSRDNTEGEIAKTETKQIEGPPPAEIKLSESADSKGVVSRMFSGIGGIWQKITGFIVRAFRTFLKAVRVLFHLPGRIIGFFSKISLTFTGICDKITKWKDLLDEETSRAALSLVWGKGMKLLRHIFPQKLEGHITFGLENPAATGQVLAVIGATCPIHRNAIAVTPVFDEEILEGEVSLRGRIYFAALVKLAIEVYFNKDIKAFLKSIKQMEG